MFDIAHRLTDIRFSIGVVYSLGMNILYMFRIIALKEAADIHSFVWK